MAKTSAFESPGEEVRTSALSGRGAYQHTQKWYAEAYGVSLPTIKRWWKLQRPLDDPEAMGEYLSNRGRPPDFDKDVPAPAKERDADDIAADRVNRFGADFLEGDGLSAGIRRLRVAEREAADRYAEAVAMRQSRESQNRLGEWMSILEALRKIEKDNPEILRENDKSVPISDVEDVVTKLLLMVVERLRTLPLRGMQSLVGMGAVEIRGELEAEIERCLDPIRHCEFVPEVYREQIGIAVVQAKAVPESGTVKKRKARKN